MAMQDGGGTAIPELNAPLDIDDMPEDSRATTLTQEVNSSTPSTTTSHGFSVGDFVHSYGRNKDVEGEHHGFRIGNKSDLML